MRYATVTDNSPLEVTGHDGDTTAVPVADYPAGATFAINDIVLIDTIGDATIIVQKMNG